MTEQDRTYSSRSQANIAQCWTTQLIFLLSQPLLQLWQSAIRDDFSGFIYHPGEVGWRFYCFLIPLYALMSVWVRVYEKIWFRWLNLILLLLTVVYPISHQAIHFSEGRLPDISIMGELAAVFVGTVGCVIAWRWARSR